MLSSRLRVASAVARCFSASARLPSAAFALSVAVFAALAAVFALLTAVSTFAVSSAKVVALCFSAATRAVSFAVRVFSASARSVSALARCDSAVFRASSLLMRSTSAAWRTSSLSLRLFSADTRATSVATRCFSAETRSLSLALSVASVCLAVSIAVFASLMSCVSSAVGGRITSAVFISTESSPSISSPLNAVSPEALLSTMQNCSYSLLRQSLPKILPRTSRAYVPTDTASPSTRALMILSSAVSML